MKEEYDAIIVGSGVAGALMAYKLAQQGVKVLILEAGDHGPGDEDNELSARLEKVRIWATSSPKIPSAPYLDEQDRRPQEKAPHPIVTEIKDGYYDQSGTAETYKSNYQRLIGGSTWHWLGNVPRFLPNDFKMKSVYGVAVDWPIIYDDLEPYYVEAEHAIGVSGDHEAWDGVHGAFRSREFPMQKVWECYGDLVIKRRLAGKSVRGLPLEILPTPQARNSEPFDNRPPCAGNSICVPICPIQAKYDATATVKKATNSHKDDTKLKKNAEIRSRCVVSKLDTDSNKRVTKVHYIQWSADKEVADKPKVATARIVVMAAHAIESTRLLLISGLANGSDQVGRNLMDHPAGNSGAILPEPVFPFRGPPTTSGIDLFRDGEFRNQEGAFRMSMGNDGWGRQESPSRTVGRLVRDEGLFGAELRQRIADRVTRMFRISYSSEQLPHPENRVTLSDENEKFGAKLPRPKIQYDVDDYNKRGRRTAREVAAEIFRLLEAEESVPRYPNEFLENAYSGAGHIMGTTRMGNDPTSSVVDAECRAHEHPNLFVVTSGNFPTGGTANPTLTVAALALRAADAVRDQLKREI